MGHIWCTNCHHTRVADAPARIRIEDRLLRARPASGTAASEEPLTITQILVKGG